MPNPEDELFWSSTLGLDLAERTVPEAEVLEWRIVQQKLRLLRDVPRIKGMTNSVLK